MEASRVRLLCEARARLRVDAEARLAEIARKAAESPFHFIREFEALFGETPHQARITARLERARVLVAGGIEVFPVCLILP